MRKLIQWLLPMRNESKITDIDNDAFAALLPRLEAIGWQVYARYGGIDAGIDYDCVRLKCNGVKLKCEWTPWDTWSMEGPAAELQEIGSLFNLVVRSGQFP